MPNCETVRELLDSYAAGELNARTKKAVDQHLAGCLDCREIYLKKRMSGKAEASGDAIPTPSSQKQSADRRRRWIYAILVGMIGLFACTVTALSRFIFENTLDIPTPHLPGGEVVWIIIGIVTLVIYLGGLLWRKQGQAGKWYVEVPLAVLAALPLLGVGLATHHLIGTTSAPLVFLGAAAALLAALLIPLSMLSRLPYATLATALILILLSAFLVGQLSIGAAEYYVDASIELPTDLGHPAQDVPPQEAAQVDLTGLGLERERHEAVTRANSVWIGGTAQAVQAAYRGDGREAYVSVIEFESLQDAEAFFDEWAETVSEGAQIARFEVNPPGVMGQGKILRTYSSQGGMAFNAWQTSRWVTIIEVPGPLTQAGPLARQIKEAIADSYRAQ